MKLSQKHRTKRYLVLLWGVNKKFIFAYKDDAIDDQPAVQILSKNVNKAILSLSFAEKALSHWLHWYGFSPVWVLMWSNICRKCLLTLTTLICCFTSVSPHMYLKIINFRESLAAMPTLIRFELEDNSLSRLLALLNTLGVTLWACADMLLSLL